MKNIKRLNWLIVVAMLAILPVSVTLAQETSSAIGGTVVDSNGSPVADATVTVTHVPTGAVKTLSTNDKGNYQARGLRVGGPYVVTINKSGFGDAKEENLYISLGETRDVDATIVSDSVSLDSIEVVGVAQSMIFNADNMGSGTNIDRDLLENLPTVSREVKDFITTDSRINIHGEEGFEGISVSGVNNRYNNFSIDGVASNDPFGLEANGFAGLGQPFNIDTIQELNVQLSPYDVTKSNFTGANINAVTKSGTNEFTGSLNVQYGNEDFRRDDEAFTNEIYSLTVGGPIIEDKLFFFLGYEDSSRTNVQNTSNLIVNSDGTPNLEGIAALESIQNIASSQYGFDIGSFTASDEQLSTKENLLVKLDWQVNDNHRASFRYSTNEDNRDNFPSFGGNNASFSSHWYTDNYKNDSYALNVYSDWSPNFTTEFRYSNSSFDKNPVGLSNLPQIEIRGVLGDTVRAGREAFRHANSLSTTDDTFYLEGNYFVGNHTIKGGIDIQKHDIFNTFVFNSYGVYTFNSIDEFAAGEVARYDLRIGSDPADPYPAADWAWTGNGIFLQDNWMVNEKLTLQYGLRYDKPDTNDSPLYNPEFEAAFGFRNDNVIDSGVLQPRFGFNYDMSDELNMQLRGGIGVFSGGSPNVWLSNPFTNPGGNVSTYRIQDGSVAFNPDGSNPTIPDGGFAIQDVDVLSDDFKLPTVVKTNIALDAELPWWGLEASFEYEYTKQKDGIFYQHLNLGTPTGTLPDGRLSYYGNPEGLNGGSEFNRNRSFGDVLLLSNSGRGNVKNATISLSKRTEHFYTKASYTHSSSSEVSTGTSSRAISNWNNRPTVNPNEDEVGVSAYQIENAFNFVFNYNNNFFGDTMTNIGLVWTSRDGEPLSYNYSNDINGDGIRDNDLIYVPNVDEYVLVPDSNFENYADQVAAFETFLMNTGLSQYRGQIAPRYAFKAPRVNLWDLKIKQELPDWGFGRASLFFSIRNLGNLINKDWGQVRLGSFDGVNIMDLEGFDDQGRYELDWNGRAAGNNLFKSNGQSQWAAQVGFRFDW
jgi:hypothetical protein